MAFREPWEDVAACDALKMSIMDAASNGAGCSAEEQSIPAGHQEVVPSPSVATTIILTDSECEPEETQPAMIEPQLSVPSRCCATQVVFLDTLPGKVQETRLASPEGLPRNAKASNTVRSQIYADHWDEQLAELEKRRAEVRSYDQLRQLRKERFKLKEAAAMSRTVTSVRVSSCVQRAGRGQLRSA